MSSQSFVNQ
ncbi:hypothetical protein E2C01_095177 [Portunus trituberculatus]|uniref:Uncharacterized protein n=1 Tax=Portunus trituberculatus TaxID=210409 RepID=A0A5B7K530_PORTR|nr:hypothetical protein [Portunus trituberculatus]